MEMLTAKEAVMGALERLESTSWLSTSWRALTGAQVLASVAFAGVAVASVGSGGAASLGIAALANLGGAAVGAGFRARKLTRARQDLIKAVGKAGPFATQEAASEWSLGRAKPIKDLSGLEIAAKLSGQHLASNARLQAPSRAEEAPASLEAQAPSASRRSQEGGDLPDEASQSIERDRLLALALGQERARARVAGLGGQSAESAGMSAQSSEERAGARDAVAGMLPQRLEERRSQEIKKLGSTGLSQERASPSPPLKKTRR